MSGVVGVVKAVTTMALLLFQYDTWGPGGDKHKSADSTTLAGLVLARKGSKGIPGKNMAMLNGHPLIHWVLEEMIQSGEFHSIWVSTDDMDVKEYVTSHKPNVKLHDRAWYTATDEATSLIAVQEFLSFHPEIGTVALVQATSPFLQRSYLSDAVTLMNSYNLDSVFSVTRQWKLRWSTVSDNDIRSGHWTKSLNFDSSQRPRRQDWSGELIENGMFYFVRRQIVLDGLLQGTRSYYVEIPQCHSIEIDTPADLQIAQVLMQHIHNEQVQKSQIIQFNSTNSSRSEL